MGNIASPVRESVHAGWCVVETAWGWCGLLRGDEGIAVCSMPSEDRTAAIACVVGGSARDTEAEAPDDPLLAEAARLLVAYFEGQQVGFDLPLDLRGVSDFSARVLRACSEIPWGETRSYGEMAMAAGSPRAARAAGQALGRNRIPLIVPCHRVIGADGSLVGFGSGLDLKQRLLAHEQIPVA